MSIPARKQPFASPSQLRRARLAVAFIFFLNGVLLATWAARIPAVQARLMLSPAALGTILFGGSAGALAGMNSGGYLAARYSSRLVVILATASLCLALVLVAIAPSFPTLLVVVALLGGSAGGMDVAMNTQGVAVERLYGRPILNSFHACYSLGSLGGALVGGLIAGRGFGLLPHFGGIALVGVILALCALPALLPPAGDVPEGGAGATFARPTRATLILGLVAFCALFGEGAMADWSALYLNNNLHSGAGLAPLGYAVFSVTMMVSRSIGDTLTARFGAVLMVRLGGLLAAFGLTLVLVTIWLPLALLGFALVGCGFSVIFPLTLSAAGRRSSQAQAASTALAAVATCGYMGLMAGPPVIGFAASLLGLRLALGTIVLLSVLAALLAGAVGGGRGSSSSSSGSSGSSVVVERGGSSGSTGTS
jgi:MFS family permease